MSTVKIRIQYNICIPQKTLYEHGLIEKIDAADASILYFLKQFIEQDNIKYILEENKTWYWIAYQHIIDQLPILNISSKRHITRRINKYIDLQLICKKTKHQKTYFHFNNSFFKIFEFQNIYGQKSPLSIDNIDINKQPIMSNNHNTNILIPISDIYKESFFKFWEKYPHAPKEKIISTAKYFEQNKLHEKVPEIIKAIEHYQTTKAVKDGYAYSPIRFLEEIYPNYIEGVPEGIKQHKSNNKKIKNEVNEFIEKIAWLDQKWTDLSSENKEAVRNSNAAILTKQNKDVFSKCEVEIIRKAGGIEELLYSYTSNETKEKIERILKNDR